MASLSGELGACQASQRTITRGDDISLWRFGVADDVLDTLICQDLWKIPEDADLREEANKVATFAQRVCTSFLEFAGDYVYRCLSLAWAV